MSLPLTPQFKSETPSKQDDISVNTPQSPTKLSYVNTTPRLQKKRSKRQLSDQDTATVIATLQNTITQRDAEISAMSSRILQLENELRRGSLIVHRRHPLTPVQHIINDDGRRRTKVGRSGSVATSIALAAILDTPKSAVEQLADKIIQVFQSPVDYIQYLQSSNFAQDLITLCDAVNSILELEPRCIFIQSPVYVIGDIHGNLEDLHFFADNLWKLGIELTAGQFLFLGDYVDRGLNSLECIAYLFSMKILHPRKIHLLRGNHETRDVNGWEEHYKEKSFLFQSKV